MFITNISKDWLYKTYSQESIFQKYGVPITNTLFRSSFRKDKKPTCKLQYYNNELLYFDNADTAFRGVNCIKLVMILKNLSYREALQEIYISMTNDSEPTKSAIKTLVPIKKERAIIKLNFKEFTEEELDYWKQYNIDLDLLNKYNIRSVQSCYIKNKDDEFFNCVDRNEICFAYLFSDESCKIYFPHRKLYRFITNSNYIQGLSQLDNPKYIVWTKSYKDILCLSLFGIQGLAMQSENVIPKIPENLKHLPQYYLSDADQRGLRAALKVKKELKIPILVFPKELYKIGCKDLSDGIKVLGFNKVNELVQETICKFSI